MICRLCLKDINDVIQIFDVVGLELNVATVLTKYFWFEPKNDDPISTVVCNSCWIKVSDFHEFYRSVEEAHHLLTERFSVKTEEKSSQRTELTTLDGNFVNNTKASTNEIAAVTQLATESRIQGTAQNQAKDDESEIEFSVILAENDIEEGKNSDNDNNDEVLVNGKDQSLNQSMVQEVSVELEESIPEQKYFSDDVISFDEHYFVEDILDQAEHLEDEVEEEEDKLIIKKEPSEVHELRRSARHNKCRPPEANLFTKCKQQRLKKKENENKLVTKSNVDTPPKRKGRPPKSASDLLSNQSKNKSPDALQRHTKELKSQANDEKIADYMRLRCHLCAEEVATFAKLRHHFTQTHQQTAYVICCNKKFYKRILLVEHIDKHLDPECYKCTECNKVFADKQCLRNHKLLKHQPDDVKTFECEHCPKKFAKPYLLEQHLIVHAARDHICEICQRGFPSAPQLASHVKVTHSNSYGTMCHICAKLIRGRAAFERHQLEHAGVKLPKVQCEKCGSWHKNKYSLQKHRRRHNEEGKLHVCSICSKVAPNRSALLSHFRYVHAAERTYECSICRKAFKKPLNLKEHMTMHTGEVLYSCPYCPKTFNSNANMHSHRKKMHPREFEEQRKLRRARIAADADAQQQQLIQEINTKNESTLLQTKRFKDHDVDITIYATS